MANQSADFRKKLRLFKFEHGLLQKVKCSEEENRTYERMFESGEALPEGISQSDLGYFYRDSTSGLTESEIAEYLIYKQLDLLRSIRAWLIFLVVLAVIGIYFLWLIMTHV